MSRESDSNGVRVSPRGSILNRDGETAGGETPETVLVECPRCGTATRVEFGRSRAVIRDHNDMRHRGDYVAGLCVWTEEGTVLLPHPNDAEAILRGEESFQGRRDARDSTEEAV